MITFLEHTWILWWAVAIVVVLRWFHQACDRSQAVSNDLLPRAGSNLPVTHGTLFPQS